MSVATEINKLKTNLVNAYNAISDKGGTIPLLANADNLASAIQTITGGGETPDYLTPTITNYDAVDGVITGARFIDSNDVTLGNTTVYIYIREEDAWYPLNTDSISQDVITLTEPIKDQVEAAGFVYPEGYTFEGYTVIKVVNNYILDPISGEFVTNFSIDSTHYIVYGDAITDRYGVVYWKHEIPISPTETELIVDAIPLSSDADCASICGTGSGDMCYYTEVTANYIPIDEIIGFQYGDLATAASYTPLSYIPHFKQPIIYDSRFNSKTFADLLKNATEFNTVVEIPNTRTSVGNNFLYNCKAFNQPLKTLSSVTSVGNSFLYNCIAFNQPIGDNNYITGSNYFLYNCVKFNQPIDIFVNVPPAMYGNALDYFMTNCSAFNGNITLNINPQIGGAIGSSFLQNCYAFNKPLDVSNLCKVGSDFMSGCKSFNQFLNLSRLSSFDINFLYGCESFNQPLNLNINGESSAQMQTSSIPLGFLTNCYNFNSDLSFGGIWRFAISQPFLENCKSFNKSLDAILLRVSELRATKFLYGCESFNQPLDFSVIQQTMMVQDYFMYNCYSFNNTIKFPASYNQNFGNTTYFMCNCRALQKFDMSNMSTLFRLDNFMTGCNSLTELNLGTLDTTRLNVPNTNTVLTVSNTNFKTYMLGIAVFGTYNQQFVQLLGQPSTSYYKRNIMAVSS